MGIPKKTIRPMFKKDKWKILRGDTVMITAGKDRGRTGTVSRVIRDSRKPLVVVEGLNLVGSLHSLYLAVSLSTQYDYHCRYAAQTLQQGYTGAARQYDLC